MEPLDNPELAWERSDALPTIARLEVERRVGRPVERFEPLGGGLANLNVAIDGGAVLRIYLREPGLVGKEVALLRRRWRTFRVPAVLATGDDFVLLEHVPHGRLQGSALHGKAVGRALAEIHATRFASAGMLGPGLTVTEAFDDFVGAVRRHAAEEISSVDSPLPRDIGASVLSVLDGGSSAMRRVAGADVLLHGDFKVSNLHWTARDELLVLDWEFAYAGSALMDIGQLMRWCPPPAFVEGFAESYLAHGGRLPDAWQGWAAVFDLVNLVGLVRRSPVGSRRAGDATARIAATLASAVTGRCSALFR